MSSLRLIGMPQEAGAQQQLALAGQLLELLQAEFTALEAGDADGVGAIAAQKLRLLKALDPTARNYLPDGQRERFDELLREARESNLRNGEFVAAQQNYVRARFAGLAQVAGMPNYYNADGGNHLQSRPRSTLGQA